MHPSWRWWPPDRSTPPFRWCSRVRVVSRWAKLGNQKSGMGLYAWSSLIALLSAHCFLDWLGAGTSLTAEQPRT